MTRLLSAKLLERIARLDVGTRRARGGRPAGDRASGVAGSGTVFHEHRSYEPGDDLRYVDWSAWGRLRSLQVKVYELEESLDLHVLVDRTASLGSGVGSKLEAGCRAAAMVAGAALARGDTVRIQPLPADDGDARRSHPRSGRGAESRTERARDGGRTATAIAAARTGALEFTGRRSTSAMLAELAGIVPGARSQLGDALRDAFPELRRRGAAVLVTDFLGDPTDWRRAIDFLVHRGVETFAFHVVAAEERHPSFAGPVRLRDAETGVTQEIDLDDAALGAYERRFEHHLREVGAFLRGRGVVHVLVETSHAGEGDLLRLLLRRGVLR